MATDNAPVAPTRADVLAAAEELLEADGAEGLSMRRLAASVGASYQVVYSRIGAKPEVVRALHALGFARLTAAVAAISAAPGTTARLIEMGQAYLAAARAHPRMFDVMFGTPVTEFVRDDAAIAVEWKGFEATWVGACREWLDSRFDDRRKGASVRVAWRLWTAVHGITVLDLAGHPSPSGDVDTEIAGVVTRLLYDPLE